MKIRTIVNNERIIYPLAKAWIRFLTRFLDTAFTLLISIGLYYLVRFINNNDFEFGRIALITVILMLLLMIIYYLIIPYFTKGYTLFRWVFKIKLIELISLQKYFWHLILHELFLWIHFMILTLIYVIITITQPLDNQQTFFLDLFNLSNSASANQNIVAIIFKVFYSLCAVVSIIFLVFSFINSGKRNLQDLMSWTAMIAINKPTPQNKNKNINNSWGAPRKFNLPGVMDLSDIDKIKSKKYESR